MTKTDERALQEVPKYHLTDMDSVKDFSKNLESFISQNNLSTTIQGNKHAHVEAWGFAAMCFGYSHLIKETIPLHRTGDTLVVHYKEVQKYSGGKQYKKEVPSFVQVVESGNIIPQPEEGVTRTLIKPYFSYKAIAELVKDGEMVGTGEAICSNAESKKIDFDEYAVLSMAQTRAVGKAYRLKLGFVFKLSGFQGTPAEEMDEPYTHKKKDEPVKPKLTTKQWQQFQNRYKTGDASRDDLEEYFELTDAQIKWIDSQ